MSAIRLRLRLDNNLLPWLYILHPCLIDPFLTPWSVEKYLISQGQLEWSWVSLRRLYLSVIRIKGFQKLDPKLIPSLTWQHMACRPHFTCHCGKWLKLKNLPEEFQASCFTSCFAHRWWACIPNQPLIPIFTIISVYGCMCVLRCICMDVDMFMGVRGQPSVVLFMSYPLLLFKTDSLTGLKLTKQAGWPTSQTHGSTSLHLPSVHVTNIHYYWISKCGFWGPNSVPHACKVGTLLTEPFPWSSCWLFLFKVLFFVSVLEPWVLHLA